MTLCASESDGSKMKRRSRRTERRPDDCEGVVLDCPSATFGARGALSKQEGALTKRKVILSNQDVTLTSSRAPFAIRNGAFRTSLRHSRNQRGSRDSSVETIDSKRRFFDEIKRGAIRDASFPPNESDEGLPKARSRFTSSKSTRKCASTNKETQAANGHRRRFHSRRHGWSRDDAS